MNAVLTVIAGIIMALAAVAALRLRNMYRRLARQEEQLRRLAGEVHELRNDLGALLAGARGLGERLGRHEQQMRHLAERQDQMELRNPGERPYRQAIRMVHRGASAGDLVDAFGMTRSEADLVVMMHRLDKAV